MSPPTEEAEGLASDGRTYKVPYPFGRTEYGELVAHPAYLVERQASSLPPERGYDAANIRDDILYVSVSSHDWLPAGRCFDRYGYMVMRDFGGDFKAAAIHFGGGASRATRPRQASRPSPDTRRSAAYAAKGLENEVARVARAEVGRRNTALIQASFSVGQLVAGGLLDADVAGRALWTVATESGLTQRETVATIRSGFKAGARYPRNSAP
jgi:hypothetical protein